MIRTIGLFRAQQSARLGTERDAQGRVWCQLFPLGTWHRSDFPGGKLELTPELLKDFIANWKAGGSPPLPVDYNHEEDGPAAGWIEDLRLSAAGELEGAIKWTDDAAEDIKADRRRYLSPTWAMQHVNRRTGTKGGPWLYGAALLNDPFYDSMPRVAASAASAATSPTHPPTEALAGQEKRMDKKRICAALGLPEDCGDEEVMAALEAKCKASLTAAADAEKLTAAVKAKDDTEAKLKAALEDGEKLRASLIERDAMALIDAGKREGKALEPLKDIILAAAKRDMEEAKKLVAAFPVSVPLKAEGAPVEAEKSGSPVEQFEALVAEKLAAGMKATEAYRVVAAEHRELAAKAFTLSNPNNTRA